MYEENGVNTKLAYMRVCEKEVIRESSSQENEISIRLANIRISGSSLHSTLQ